VAKFICKFSLGGLIKCGILAPEFRSCFQAFLEHQGVLFLLLFPPQFCNVGNTKINAISSPRGLGDKSKRKQKKQKNNPSYLGTYLTLPLMIQAFELTPQLFPIPALPLHKQMP